MRSADMARREDELRRAMDCVAFLQNQLKHRANIREKSKSANKDLLTAHQFAFSAVISYQGRIQGIRYEARDLSTKGRMSLIAQFIQGIDITETAISEGLYANAANLLKQELETIAAIDEYKAGNRKDGDTPRFSGMLRGFGRRYGELNEIAHPTRGEIVERLSTFSEGDRYGPTTIPQFNSQLYQMFYGTQAMFLIMLLARMRTVFVEILQTDWDDEEARLATSALNILVAHKIMEIRN